MIKLIISKVILGLLLVLALPNTASADIVLSPEGPYRSLRAAIADAGPGGTVFVRGGRYAATDLEIPYSLKIVGDGTAVFTSPRRVRKGLLVPLRGTTLEIEGVILRGAESADLNGAGIRFEGNGLYIRNCVFQNNDNAVLATGSAGGEVTVDNSTFISNGHGDGYSHGIYVSSAVRFVVTNSRFEGSRIGHHVKSVASQETIVRNSVFDDANGRTSYMIDASSGGRVIIEGNTFTRRASAEQEHFFNYDSTRGGQKESVTIRNNTFVNFKRNARLMRNPERAPVVFEGNSIDNREGASLRLPDPAAAQAVPAEPNSTGVDPALLENLTPQQRRSVERLMRQGEIPQHIDNNSQQNDTGHFSPPEGSNSINRHQSFASQDSHAFNSGGRSDIRKQERVQRLQNRNANEVAPVFWPASGPGEITGLNIIRRPGQHTVSNILTFGHAFAVGDVGPQDILFWRGSTDQIPIQMDAKALHADGSVRHAVLTMDMSPLQGNSSMSGVLVNAGGAGRGLSLNVNSLGYALTVSISGRTGSGTTFREKVQVGSLVKDALERGEMWLNGALAVETSVYQMVGPFLGVRADVRFLANGAVRTRLTLENHKTFIPGNRDLVYDIQVQDGAHTVLSRNNIRHHRGANWSEVMWRGAEPGFVVQYDPAYLRDSYAVPPFDLRVPVDNTYIRDVAREQLQHVGLFSGGSLEKYFPVGGARDEVAMLANWDVHWIKSQSLMARDLVLEMAAHGGGIPLHFEDDQSRQPIRIDQRPSFWADERGTETIYAPHNIPADYFNSGDGGWTIDIAHKPLLSYTAYLITGDAYFARELAHEAAFCISFVWPEWRNGGTLIVEDQQVRSRAWGMRDVGAAAWILPSDWSMTAYFDRVLQRNLRHLVQEYVVNGKLDAAGETEGWFAELVGTNPARITPWQNDYFMLVLAQEALRGSSDARQIVEWATNYHIGRFTGPGMDPRLGATFAHILKDPETQTPITSWAEVARRTSLLNSAYESYPNSGLGYVVYAYSTLASIYSVTGDARALEAIRALARVQKDHSLFSENNPYGVHTHTNFLMGLRTPSDDWRSVTDLIFR